MCKIVFHAVPEYRAVAGYGSVMAVGRCEIHHIDMPIPCTADDLCSIGKIEAATTKALAAIDKAAADAIGAIVA
jgi:hypothetical protein